MRIHEGCAKVVSEGLRFMANLAADPETLVPLLPRVTSALGVLRLHADNALVSAEAMRLLCNASVAAENQAALSAQARPLIALPCLCYTLLCRRRVR